MTDPDDASRSGREARRQALARLAKAPPRPSLTSELFALLPEIDAALAAGASREEVRLALAEQGLSVSPGAFRGALYRARKRRDKGRSPVPEPAPAAAKPRAAPADKAARDAWASSVIPDEERPRLLDRLTRKREEEK